MNYSWSQVIDYFQTPQNLFDSVQEYKINNYYQSANDWMTQQKHQMIGNYPNVYDTVTKYENLWHIITIMFYFWLLDKLIIKQFLNKARWFSLHAFANALVVYYTMGDVWHLLIDPLKSFNRQPRYEGLNITVALHFYHAIFFKNLLIIDWIHHVLMISIAIGSYFCPPSIIVVTNGLLFYLNGLPGGSDYILLTLVKYGVVSPIKEKEWNSYLNILIRSPGILIGTRDMYLTTLYTDYEPNKTIQVIVLIILYWNAQYFTYRVLANYFTKLTKKCEQFKKREGRHLSVTDESNCIDDNDVITEMDVVYELNDNEGSISRIIEDVSYQSDEEQ